MIQANLSSTWMGRLAGFTLILPEIGEVANVFLTVYVRNKLGVFYALLVGFLTCVVSLVAAVLLFRELKKLNKMKGSTEIMIHSP